MQLPHVFSFTACFTAHYILCHITLPFHITNQNIHVKQLGLDCICSECAKPSVNLQASIMMTVILFEMICVNTQHFCKL